MTKEQQDLAWQALPKEVRDEIKSVFSTNFLSRDKYEYCDGIVNILAKLFGEHNLTSDTKTSVQSEPRFHKGDKVRVLTDVWDEVHTVVEVKGIYPQFTYKLSCSPIAWFAESTLELYTESRFKVGDKVRYLSQNHEIGEIAAYWPDEKFCYSVRFGKEYHNMAEHQLEPYTESETKDNMEEKELNLCEILKGHEGETFYCSITGTNVKIKDITNLQIVLDEVYPNNQPIILSCDGSIIFGGEYMLFPSKDQRDWNKWIEEQKSKTPKTWSDCIKQNKLGDVRIVIPNEKVYDDYPIAKSCNALLIIYQLIEFGYGGNISNEEWLDRYTKDSVKWIIISNDDNGDLLIVETQNNHLRTCPAFHTKEQAEEFLSYPENVQLLKDYFMI